MAVQGKKWPTRNDLISWWIFDKIQESPISDLDDPDKIKSWILEFSRQSEHLIFVQIYAKYSDFRVEFCNPRCNGQPLSKLRR